VAEKSKLLIIDDHHVVVEGLKRLLAEQADFEIVGAVTDSRKGLEAIKNLRPDIVILDISMPRVDGIRLTHEIRKLDKKIAIVIYSMLSEPEYLISAYRAGVCGYVLKEDPLEDLLLALKAAKGKGSYFSEPLNEQIREHMEDLELGDARSAIDVRDAIVKLSHREKEVFPLLADGKTVKEIADRLCISPKTVESHKYNIMEKLNVKTMAELTKIALKKHLIEL
jgi:RNA polymerase sigma factor (sigma-70 family)